MIPTAEGETDAERLVNRMSFSDDEITRQIMWSIALPEPRD